jgi:hypothetical protein
MELANNVPAIILRERGSDQQGKQNGWLVLLASQTREREILAVLNYKVGLEYARLLAHMLSVRYSINLIEELPTSSQAASHNLDTAGTNYNSLT